MRYSLANTAPDQPDGRCYSTTALLYGCDEPAPPGRWSCDRHAVEAWKRGQELIAEREAAEQADR